MWYETKDILNKLSIETRVILVYKIKSFQNRTSTYIWLIKNITGIKQHSSADKHHLCNHGWKVSENNQDIQFYWEWSARTLDLQYIVSVVETEEVDRNLKLSTVDGLPSSGMPTRNWNPELNRIPST